MTFLAGDSAFLAGLARDESGIHLFGRSNGPGVASAGASVLEEVRARNYSVPQAAWDFLAIALAAVVADGATARNTSPDGWTRQLRVRVALAEPTCWNDCVDLLQAALGFLTTDIWSLEFLAGGVSAPRPRSVERPDVDAVSLLSGGIDSLVGTIDLTSRGTSILAVSQTVRGDSDKQVGFASRIGGGIDLLQLNHNASTPRPDKETSQRSRSLIFIAFALIAACSTAKYERGDVVPIYLSENGFIAINPPLTDARVGSLSTRTAHPAFLGKMQRLFDEVGLHVKIINMYEEQTKGEMLRTCGDQGALEREAPVSTSCGRFQRFGYRHCGRCVPCQIRRAAFLAWGSIDSTDYVYRELGRRDGDHAQFDDVLSASMAIATADDVGIDRWIGTALSDPAIPNKAELRSMIGRGLEELRTLHSSLGIW